jgi:hypothetical protein
MWPTRPISPGRKVCAPQELKGELTPCGLRGENKGAMRNGSGAVKNGERGQNELTQIAYKPISDESVRC